jgi:hypothetical protein
MTMRSIIQAACLAAVISAAPANAEAKLFRLFGDANGDFTLPSSPLPSAATPDYFAIYATPGKFQGNTTQLDLYFYVDSSGGGFDIQDANDPDTIFSLAGAQVFGGTLASPRFISGSYQFVDFGGRPGNYTVVISGVPEPASWALMIAGFGLVGAGMRRRRVVPNAGNIQAA